jgi:hypothetical protein
VIEAFPAVGDDPWELRFTRRALTDLGADAARDTPGDIAAVRQAATHTRVSDDFVSKRQERPDAPGTPLHSVCRPDIISLHSTAGGRAATWHDPAAQVVWFLGFTSKHDYTLFEQRATTGDLLPDEQDEVHLELEREQRDFQTRIRPGLTELIARAVSQAGTPQRGTIGGLLQLELTALVIRSDGDALADVWLSVHLPLQPEASEVPGWPGGDLLMTLAGMLGRGELDFDDQIPEGPEHWRALDPAAELAIVVRNIALES